MRNVFKKFESGSILTYQITNCTFPPKKKFWAPLSHSFGESMTACCTQSC